MKTKKPILTILFALLFAFPACAQQTFHYQTYDKKTGKIFNHFSIVIGNRQGNYVHAQFDMQGQDVTLDSGQEEYILDKEFNTNWFRCTQKDQNTEYIGERRENLLLLEGMFKGEKIKKEISLERKPFYFNPKIGLMHFVQSGKKSQEFWTLKKDDLSGYLMAAERKGLEEISLGDRKVKAVKVEWAPVGFGSFFFKRTYWFREKDGAYLKQIVSGSKVRELIVE